MTRKNRRSMGAGPNLFAEHEFFDARDLVQVKYEMVRRVEAEGASITDAAAAFGFSRPSIYQAQTALRSQGFAGLLPKKRGPRSGRKVSQEVVEFLVQLRAGEPALSSQEPALSRSPPCRLIRSTSYFVRSKFE